MIPWLLPVLLLLLLHILMVVAVAELSVHPPVVRRPCDTDGMALNVARTVKVDAEVVTIQAADGVTLSAWWMQQGSARGTVMLCHGIADTAFGVMGAALLFLRNGYSVLAPDNRGHGRSAGLVSYGLRESEDLVAWRLWLKTRGVERCFGFGQSLGASSLLLTLGLGTHFDAIVAECPYSSFQRVAFDRVVQPLRKLLPGHIADWVSHLWVREIILYVRLRYQLDLSLARPVDLAKEARIPVLLIHGTADFETPAHHSEEIAAANQGHFKLWLVAGAKHTGAYAVAPDEFEKRVLAHFAGQT